MELPFGEMSVADCVPDVDVDLTRFFDEWDILKCNVQLSFNKLMYLDVDLHCEILSMIRTPCGIRAFMFESKTSG